MALEPKIPKITLFASRPKMCDRMAGPSGQASVASSEGRKSYFPRPLKRPVYLRQVSQEPGLESVLIPKVEIGPTSGKRVFTTSRL